MTLLLRTSIHLNKSLILDNTESHFSWNCIRVFFELEIWQRAKYFFRRSPIFDVISASEPTRIMTLLLRTSIIWTSPWLDWKSLFMKLHKSIFELEIWQRVKNFFRRSPIFDIISASEPTRIMTLLLRTSIHLNKTLTRLKVTFHETAQEYFLSSKFDNVLSTFFVDHLYSMLSLLQNLLRLWHSYLGPQSIWTSPWLDWKSLFMKLHKSIFELEIWQRVKYFFRRSPIFDIISASEPTRIMTLLLGPSIHLNKSLTILKVTFHETAQEYFLSSKFDNVLSTFFVDHLYPILSLLQNLLGLWHSYLGPQSFEQVLD